MIEQQIPFVTIYNIKFLSINYHHNKISLFLLKVLSNVSKIASFHLPFYPMPDVNAYNSSISSLYHHSHKSLGYHTHLDD